MHCFLCIKMTRPLRQFQKSRYFLFLKAIYLHVTNQKNHRCGSQRSRSVLLLGLYQPSNAGRLQKWNTFSKSPSDRPCTHFHDYFLFLLTWDAYLAVWDYHIHVNSHLGHTWVFGGFVKFDCWTSSDGGLTILPLVDSFVLSI